jgi:hypothetical protein
MTKITINEKYFVEKIDPLNWALKEVGVKEKGKHKGERTESIMYYYPTLLVALQDAANVIADQQAASTLEEYIDKLNEAHTAICSAIKNAVADAGGKS